MKRIWYLALSVLFCLSAHAESFVAHTNGEAHTRLLAKMFFPDTPVMASPGADGLFVWRKLDDNKTDVAIQVAFAAHYFPLSANRETALENYDLLATLSYARQALVSRTGSGMDTLTDLKRLGRPVSVGWVGNACQALIKPIFAAAGVELIYVPYKTAPEAVSAFTGGHIDLICPAAAALPLVVSSGDGHVIIDLTEHHKFRLTTQVFVSKAMPQETRNRLLALIQRPLTSDDHATARVSGIELNVRTGAAAQQIFNRDRAAWLRVVRD